MLDEIKFNFIPPIYYDASRRRDTLHLDYETYGELDLPRVGLDRYTAHRSFEVLMAAYRINSGRLSQWEIRDGQVPRELREALEDPDVEKWAFNGQFERISTIRGMKIRTPCKNWRCSMVLAYMHSFTGGLREVGEQIGLPLGKQKLTTGAKLIEIFCKPQRITRNQPYERRNWITDPELWEEFLEYNRQDVVTEEAIKNRLISYPVPEVEWDFYELDQLINDRGMPIDWDFVQNIIQMSRRRKSELLSEMSDLTGVRNPNSGAQLLPWLRSNGYPYGDLRKENVAKALNRAEELWGYKKDAEDAPAAVQVLRRRQWAAITSVTKAVAARRSVSADGRVRFMYQFAGASRTNRFAGRLVQPQNMKRTPKILDPEDNDEKLTVATDLIRSGNYDGFDLFINEPMEALSGCMRSMFRAPEGYEFKVCDYKSVESAGLGWVANCPGILKIFREKLDPYRYFGTLFYRKAYDQISREERNICKPPMLGCGYRLSAGTIYDGVKTGLLKYAEDMGVDLTQEQADHGVRTFRVDLAPEVVDFWKECEKAIRYVLQTHEPYTLGYLRFEWMKPYLLIRLPSGRYIYYYKPRLEPRVVDTGRTKKVRSRGEAYDGAPAGTLIEVPDTYTRYAFTYMGRNQRTNRWERIEGHGGVTTENVVQALTRDVLRVGLQRLHKVGFYTIGHSHDEGIAMQKIGDNFFTLELMREIYREPIEWAPGFPLDAAGWEGVYYRKA